MRFVHSVRLTVDTIFELQIIKHACICRPFLKTAVKFGNQLSTRPAPEVTRLDAYCISTTGDTIAVCSHAHVVASQIACQQNPWKGIQKVDQGYRLAVCRGPLAIETEPCNDIIP